MREPIPVTVLVGFLGSGKTTLLNHILANADRRYAVIVNDFAELGIDAKLVRYRTEELVKLSNGCICCTLRGDLLEELRALSELPQMDYILVESTGLGEPLPIAQTFYMDDLRERVRLDNIVTVLDASNFWRYYESELDDAASDEPIALAPLLVDQLEFCTTIVLNKVDLAHPDDVDALESLARQLNPSALILQATYAQVPTRELVPRPRPRAAQSSGRAYRAGCSGACRTAVGAVRQWRDRSGGVRRVLCEPHHALRRGRGTDHRTGLHRAADARDRDSQLAG
jgi:G3E family GTPase